jgi:hypothetical protein
MVRLVPPSDLFRDFFAAIASSIFLRLLQYQD